MILHGPDLQVRSLHALADLVGDGEVFVLSGAGLSTESGIPDYRGPSSAGRPAQPMTYQTFVGSERARRRYWARSHVGWRHIARARPNDGHLAVARLQYAGLLAGIITQNVDGLHQAAGASDVVELHGNLDRVVCLNCGERSPRAVLDARLRAVNRSWTAQVRAVNPDGDVAVDDDAVDTFRIVECATCGGVLKPDVVFFGESVPKPRVDACYDLVEQAGCVLVLGSSLTVMSGLRFVRHAAKHDIPVAIVNQGETRGDPLAMLRVDGPLGPTLTRLVENLVGAVA